MATYLEMLKKIQDLTLDNVKQIQSAQIATLKTVRELITELPTAKGAPTFAQLTELGNSFATQLLDQEKAFANQIADAVKPVAEVSALAKSN